MVNINVPPSLWAEITQTASRHNMPRNEFIEQSLRFALDHLGPEDDEHDQ